MWAARDFFFSTLRLVLGEKEKTERNGKATAKWNQKPNKREEKFNQCLLVSMWGRRDGDEGEEGIKRMVIHLSRRGENVDRRHLVRRAILTGTRNNVLFAPVLVLPPLPPFSRCRRLLMDVPARYIRTHSATTIQSIIFPHSIRQKHLHIPYLAQCSAFDHPESAHPHKHLYIIRTDRKKKKKKKEEKTKHSIVLLYARVFIP